MKRIFKAVLFSLLLCAGFGQSAHADSSKYVKSSYTVKENSSIQEKKISLIGTKTKYVKFYVKKSGTIKLDFSGKSTLKNKEYVTVQLLNSKGKTISTKKVTKTSKPQIIVKLKKGTYRLKVTTGKIKRNSKRAIVMNMAFNDTFLIRPDSKKIYNMSVSKGVSKFKLVNTKNRCVVFELKNTTGTDYNDYWLEVRNSKNKVVLRENVWLDEPDYSPVSRYLPKGTYTVVCHSEANAMQWLKITSNKKYENKIFTTATSKSKAVTYTGKAISMAYTNPGLKKQTQWIKVDTAKRGYKFHMDVPSRSNIGYEQYQHVVVYDKAEKKIKDIELIGGQSLDAEYGSYTEFFEFKKGTGIYYVSFETLPTLVTDILPN
ncbi:MAG: hypothetical protein Q4F05_18340 [bacterium]|nr:hypothetical protein [bacterium]